MAERVGFEPTIRLPVCRISSAVLSTTQPPLRFAGRRFVGAGCLIAMKGVGGKSEIKEIQVFFLDSLMGLAYPPRVPAWVTPCMDDGGCLGAAFHRQTGRAIRPAFLLNID